MGVIWFLEIVAEFSFDFTSALYACCILKALHWPRVPEILFFCDFGREKVFALEPVMS